MLGDRRALLAGAGGPRSGPEGQSGAGRVGVVGEGDLGGAGAGRPRVPREEPAGKSPAWLKRELGLELWGKTRVCGVWEKGRAPREDYKDVTRL